MRDYRQNTRPIAVMHMTDTLEIGGAERMAVNLVNCVPRSRVAPHLCTTRRSGPLADLIASDVPQLRLNRRHRLDVRAVRRLVSYIRENEIEILHAHGTALFTAVMASLFPPFPSVVWHIHFGRYAATQSPGRFYRLAGNYATHTIAVSEALADWARYRLRMPADRVVYIPNFLPQAITDDQPNALDLPGKPGERIVCVANFLPVKDHLTLLDAMGYVVQERPSAHLLLVGGSSNPAYEKAVRAHLTAKHLSGNVSLLGQRRDVPTILRACDIGVLSSVAEGFPLALIEYGEAALPAVVTRVGQCADVVGNGTAGIAVPPSTPHELAQALLSLLNSPEQRHQLGQELHCRVRRYFSTDSVVERVCGVYEHVTHRTQRPA